MVKLTGPGLSAAAAGTIGKIMTYSSSKGRAYVKKRPTPKQPRSGLQVSMRAMMTFLTKQWKQLTANQQATWKDVYDNAQLNTYNSFLRYNLERWRRRAAPSKAYPATEEGAIGMLNFLSAAGGPRHVKLDMWLSMAVADNWTILLFHSDAASPDPDVKNLIHVQKADDLEHHYWTHSPLAAGTHYYKTCPATDDGKLYAIEFDEKSAVVT